MLLYDLSPYYTVAHKLLEECSAGLEDSSLVSADGSIDSAGSKSQHINLLVTSGSLIPSLVKCMLFRFDNMITHENGQSSNFLCLFNAVRLILNFYVKLFGAF